MRNLYILFVVTLFAFVFSVGAIGEIRKIDIQKGQTVILDLGLKEGIELDLYDGRHILNVNKITDKGADLDVFLFVDEDQKISYVTVSKKQNLKLDFDKDGKGEIYVSFNKFLENQRVSLIVYYSKDEDFESNEITGEVIAEKDSSTNLLSISVIIASFIVIILVIFMIVYTKKKKKRKD